MSAFKHFCYRFFAERRVIGVAGKHFLGRQIEFPVKAHAFAQLTLSPSQAPMSQHVLTLRKD